MSYYVHEINMGSVGMTLQSKEIKGISPAVIRFIEGRVMHKVVGVKECLDVDGYCFAFDGGDSVTVSKVYIENLEREFGDQGLMSRNQFEEMIMQKQFGDRVHSPSDICPEYCDGTMHCNGTIRGAKFDACVEDESGASPESGADRFRRSLRKVYWYRYLKNKLK